MSKAGVGRIPLGALGLLLTLTAAAAAHAEEPGASAASERSLRWLDPAAPDYRTPRAGEGFRTRVFGRDVEVDTRDRRSTTAWDLGVGTWLPAPEGRTLLPFAAAYLWRRPDEDHFLRATISVLDNDVVAAHSLAPGSPFEAVAGLDTSTVPFASSERIDGERIDEEELLDGSVVARVGLGFRRQLQAGFVRPAFTDGVDPQRPDNQLSLTLTAEPGFLYFDEGKDAVDAFRAPQNTFTLAGRLALRWDAMQRNLLDLLHEGYALGFDASQGWRANWEDWGVRGSESAERSRYPLLLQPYAVVAGGVPGAGERHRLLGSFHGGWGRQLDRFSAPSVGGGPSGDEFLSLARPVVPGATIGEFSPDHHAVGVAEYRYELFFFTYLSARTSLAWLDRDRLSEDRRIRSENDLLSSVGARLTTGFLFRTRLQLDYNYNFDVIRNRRRGANEVVLHLSRSF